jgi:hypothetical protein
MILDKITSIIHIKSMVMNKRMKRLRAHGILLFVGIAALAVNSCEVADDIIGNASVAKLTGEWTCDETSEFFKSTLEIYTVYISPDPDKDNGIIIDNFYALGDIGVRATVSGSSVIIGTQTVEGGFTIAGSGSISSNSEEISWVYTVDDGSGVVDHVTAVYTKN